MELLLKIFLRCWVGGEEEHEKSKKRQSKEWLGEQRSWLWLHLRSGAQSWGWF